MSASKFRFVSPGVFINEIDNSQLPRTPEDMGPVIIGRSSRGPMMRPIRVQSFSDFVDVFGEPQPGGTGGDVWREGNKLSPTYGAYAAQAYLANSSPVTFVRLGGYENENAIPDGYAGWDVSKAYGLFVVKQNVKLSGDITGSAPLAAIIYATGTIGLVGSDITAMPHANPVLGTWIPLDDANLQFRIVVNNLTQSVNFLESSKAYIRNVLNTNPTQYDTKNYFLGETFSTHIQSKLGELSTLDDDYAVALVPLLDYEDFRQNAADANAQFEADQNSGWIISQHTAAPASYIPNADGTYDGIQKLFKLVGLTEGEWNSLNLKVTVEDIKPPPNQYVKYGTFTISIRKMEDSDVTPSYVERFTGLTLDPSSPNYISKRIGDKYTEWSYEKKTFIEYGTYDNQSKFVRVQVNSDVDSALTDPSLLPFGFYGPVVRTTGSITLSGAGTSIVTGLLSGSAFTNGAGAVLFSMPQLPLLTCNSSSVVPSLDQTHWGLNTNLEKSKRYNKDLVDLVRAKPADYYTKITDTLTQSFMFSLDDVSGTLDAGKITAKNKYFWVQGKRLAGTSITAQHPDGAEFLLKTFNKFTMPLVGGFDGLDITMKEPFSRDMLDDTSSPSETDNYAFNSVKVAIESIADPEVVEMNLAAVPGVVNKSLTNLLIDKCEQRGDALAIIDLPEDYNPEDKSLPVVADAVSNMKGRGLNSSYGCTYFPWVLVRDTINNSKVWVPPSVIALGTFSSSQKKTELWFAPAGFNRGGLSDGAAGLPVLQTALRLSSKDRDALYEANINPIATFPAEGIVIFGQKTLQATPSALDRINVRRLMIYLKKEISRMASSVLFDPNIEVTWKRFLNLAEPFLASVQSGFGLSEYRVILDETTTTPDLVDRNIVYAKILLKPTRAIEFIALDFVITNTGASFAD
jgi:hypothetical protein